MTLEENKALARRLHVEPLQERRSSVFDELVTDDYVDADAESAEERVPGPEGISRVNDRFLRAFSDIRVTIEDQVAEGDKVVTRWSTEATHSGEFMGIPPTGKQGAYQRYQHPPDSGRADRGGVGCVGRVGVAQPSRFGRTRGGS